MADWSRATAAWQEAAYLAVPDWTNVLNAWTDAGHAAAAPHVLMRPRIFVDGDQWCALYGEDLQDGVAGFGSSPSEAMADFDAAWIKQLPNDGGPRG